MGCARDRSARSGGRAARFLLIVGGALLIAGVAAMPASAQTTGTLIVTKDAVPDSSQDFRFTINPPGAMFYDFDDDADPTLPNTRTFTVPAGNVFVHENGPPAGWYLAQATCSDGSVPPNVSVSAGETVTCTFVNRHTGTLVVKKDAVPDDPQDFLFLVAGTFYNFDDDADPALPNTRTYSLAPGGYFVGESNIPAGWYLAQSSCDDGSPTNSVSISSDEVVTCTFINSRTYARPASATPLRVPLVNAYTPCTAPNSIHVGPLNRPSCTQIALESSQLKTRAVGSASGFVLLKDLPGDPNTPADEADVTINAQVTDVQRTSNSTDYTGNVIVAMLLRITDRANNPNGVTSATVQDYPFGAPMSCTATGGAAGATCNVSSTLDTLVPNFAQEGKQAVLHALEISVKDAGPNGIIEPPGSPTCPPTCGDGDEQRFMREGVFTP